MTDQPTPHRPRFVEQSPDRISRFWTEATVGPHADGGWAVLLDGRAPKTPAKAPLVLPNQAAAQLVADEWAAQGQFLDPSTMPATRLASTAIDRIGQAREAVADEIAAKFPVIGLALSHRYGPIPVGEAALVAAVSTRHRGEAFAACQALVDLTKERLPIWKH